MKPLYESILNVDLDATTKETGGNVKIVDRICKVFARYFRKASGNFSNVSIVYELMPIGDGSGKETMFSTIKLGGSARKTVQGANIDMKDRVERFTKALGKVPDVTVKYIGETRRRRYLYLVQNPILNGVVGLDVCPIYFLWGDEMTPQLAVPTGLMVKLAEYL